MAKVVLLVTILFAGCRTGALLDIRLGAVQFLSIERQGTLQTVVALFPGGSKADLESQRTSPITFGQLEDPELCPVTAFIKWLKLRGISRAGNGLIGEKTDRIFPLFRKKSLLSTSLFSRKVQQMERKWDGNLPHFKAHTGRFTITTLSVFAKDDNGKDMIGMELLEHQLSWVRGTKVLPNYMGHASILAQEGFLDKITDIRENDREGDINEQAVQAFWSKRLDTTFLHTMEF